MKTTFSVVAPPRSVEAPFSVKVALAVRVREPKLRVVDWPPPSTATVALPLLMVSPPVLAVVLAAPVALTKRIVPSETVNAVLVPKALPEATERPTNSPSAMETAPVKAFPADGERMTLPAPTLLRPPAPPIAPEKVTSPPTAAVTLMPRVRVRAPLKVLAPASIPPRVCVLPVEVFSKAREIERTPEARICEKSVPRNWTGVALLPKAASWPATT